MPHPQPLAVRSAAIPGCRAVHAVAAVALPLAFAFLLASAAFAAPPYEVRTYIFEPLSNPDPANPATASENTLKEPFLCPYCGYSAGGDVDMLDRDANGSPDGDNNGDGTPDEAVGQCPNPWGLAGHPPLDLVRASLPERFFLLKWLGPPGAQFPAIVRGLPFHPGDQNRTAPSGSPANARSRVRVAFAFDPNAASTPGFSVGASVTQVRFLLVPPGVARPTGRYRGLAWVPSAPAMTGNPVPGSASGLDFWGTDPTTAIQNGGVRIGVHPWLAVDGDYYQIRCVTPSGSADTVMQVWSAANGKEAEGSFPVDGAIEVYTSSGGVRISMPPGLFINPFDPATNRDAWWVFGFTICNNSRTLPDFDGPPGDGAQILWISQRPNLRGGDLPAQLPLAAFSALTDPQNYFTAHAIGTSAGVADTDGIGMDPVGGPRLNDDNSLEFRLRPGETGTGMVAVIWRNEWPFPPVFEWNYDEDTAPAPGAVHPNGIQPVAARFFSSRVEVTTPGVLVPPGMPGSATDVVPAGLGVDLQNRHVGEVIRCPRHVPDIAGRGWSGGARVNPFIDPLFGAATDQFVGRGPGGDPPTGLDHTGSSGKPDWTIGCGAVHFMSSPPTECWCGRSHTPADIVSMYCNYCGTHLLARGAAAGVPEVADLERATMQVALASATQVGSHQTVPDLLRPAGVYTLASEAVRGARDALSAPGGTPYTGAQAATLYRVTNPLFLQVPAFQLPSFAPAAPAEPFRNGADQPYRGLFLAYRSADEDHPWHEDGATGAHDPRGSASGRSLLDLDGRWDTYYLCPNCGNKHPALALTAGGGGLPYLYADTYPPAAWATDLQCSYGRTVGAGAANASAAECPGHQTCPTCGVDWEVQGEGQTAQELAWMTLTRCPFDGADLTAAPATPTPQRLFVPGDLTAEEFGLFSVTASVLRKTRVAAGQRVVDLGRTAPGVKRPGGFPVEVSAVAAAPAENQGNYGLLSALRSQGVQAAGSAGPSAWTVGAAGTTDTLVLARDDVDVMQDARSPSRVARSMPVPLSRLFAATADGDPSDGVGAAETWGARMASQGRGSAGGQAAGARLEAGSWGDVVDPLDDLPVPNALGSGGYSGAALAYIDTTGNGALDFLDRSRNLAAADSIGTEYDPSEDYPLEPTIALNLRLRLVEGPLPHNSVTASDGSPAPLFLDENGDGLHDSLEVIWETNRTPGGSDPPPDAPVNLLEAKAASVLGPGATREYTWGGAPAAVTNDAGAAAARTVNGSPDAYVDPASSLKWLFWHRLAPTPTESGAASTLWSSRAAATPATDFGAPANTGFIFDSALDKSWVRGFTNPQVAAPANHWSFWNSGARGREEIHYFGDYDPRDPSTVNDRVLPVSNGIAPSLRGDLVNVAGVLTRKPAKSPFTYVTSPAPVLETDPATGAQQLHLFFSGYVPQEQNADLCYARFDLANLTDAALNCGKVPHGRIAAPGGGEEALPNALRQRFGTRHLDWLTTGRRPRSPAGTPDFVTLPAPGIDPEFYLHLVTPGVPPANHTVYRVTWTGGRYLRATGRYRLTGLTFVSDKTLPGPPPDITPLDPRSGRPVEMEVDPAAGTVAFSSPLFNAVDPSDPAALFSSAAYPGLIDAQLWASYAPYVYRLCRTAANDDCPSAFFDFSGPGLALPAGVTTNAERAALGRFIVFWRRSEGASQAPHFGRTSFVYRLFTTGIQVGHPPIGNLQTVTDVTPGGGVAVLGADLGDGMIGLGPAPGAPDPSGHLVRVTYTPGAAPNARTEYHQVVGWSEERRVNVDTVVSEGPLVVRREWFAVELDAAPATATAYLSRYWLFWTSPRLRYQLDPSTGAGDFRQTTDVYYATVVPECGTALAERSLPSR